VPLHEIGSCDGIFNGGVTDVGSTHLNGPPEVLFDHTKSESGYVSHENDERNIQIPQCPPVRCPSGMSEHDGSVDVPEVNYL
jgi:hypothetical protein